MKIDNHNQEIVLALNESLLTHRLIFQVLESVNKSTGHAVLLSEIIIALTAEQLSILKRNYKNPLIQIVRQILTGLINKKLVFIARSVRHRHYYAAVSVFSPNKMPFVFKPSYRQMVIGLIKDTVIYYKRAVRVGDIDEYLNDVRPDLKGDCKWFRPAILRLVSEGEIKVVEQTRKDRRGGHYYLLRGMDISLYNETIPPSWLGTVLESFRALWESQVEKAKANQKLPDPITTDEVRNYITEHFGNEIIPNYGSSVSGAMQTLSKPGANAAIRYVRRSSYSKCLWVPIEVKDEEIELNGLPKSDSEKANLLVRYAVKRLQRPVTMSDLAEELKLHPELKITRRASINTFLNTQTKFSAVKKIGWLNGEWYYYYGTGNPLSITAYLELKKVAFEWEKLNAVLEINDLDNCSLKAIAFGRYKLIKTTIDEIHPQLYDLYSNKKFGKVVNSEAEALYKEISEVGEQAELWLKENSELSCELPDLVKSDVVGLTTEQLWKLLQPLYPKAVKVKKIAEISNLLSDEIRKIKNPYYKPSFCHGTLETVPYLFDQTNAFIYAARKWGGRECCLQAIFAGNNLGLLRDVNFVLPGLSSNDYSERLIAIACLAFLQAKEASQCLYKLCLEDTDSGVRESALWAFAFLGGNIKELVGKIKISEKNKKVLDFALRLENCESAELWFI